MAGDYTRFTFDRSKRYSGVLMQQGRVQLDADWNEAIEIVKQSVRTLAHDTFGPAGLALLTTPDAFLGQEIQRAPSSVSARASRGKSAASSSRPRTKRWMNPDCAGSRECRVAPAGSGASSAA